MSSPVLYKSQNLDHLGLVAALYDELGIGMLVDALIPQDLEQRKLSLGTLLKAMMLNGLGFTQRALYLTPHFFADKPIERLLGSGIVAEDLNDSNLGRALDDFFEYGLTPLYAAIAMKTVRHLGLDCKIAHGDTTSFHTHGVYNSDDEVDDAVVQITQGYSRDHRPDLNQIGLLLIAEHKAGIPLFMSALAGNSQDKTAFKEMVDMHLTQLKAEVGIEYIVGDSALFTAKTLSLLGDTLWISRVPETIKQAQELIAQAAPDLMTNPKKAASISLGCQYADINQRWLIIYSPEARKRAIGTLNKHWLKNTTASYQDFQKLCQHNFSCEKDARKAVTLFQSQHPLVEVQLEGIETIARYQGKGRPKKDTKPDYYDYQIQGSLMSLIAPRETKLQRKSCYILATNQTDDTALSNEDLIAHYKNQQKVERGFRFLKDPMFMASSFFVKKPQRVMALTMIMTLCLLLYAALEYRIRNTLQKTDSQFPNQKGKSISNPTARWVFQFFTGIHVLMLSNAQNLVLNLNQHHLHLLSLLGDPYEKIYSGYG